MRAFAPSLALLINLAAVVHLQAGEPETALKKVDIGGGASIQIPVDIEVKELPVPMPGGSNLRINWKGMTLAITGLPGDMGTPDGLLNTSVSPYRKISKEKGASPLPLALASSEVRGVYITFSSASGKPDFQIFPGEGSRCITSIILANKQMTYSISLASESLEGPDYLAALQAIKAIQ